MTDEGPDEASDGARDRVATNSAPDRRSRSIHASPEDATTATTGTAAAARRRWRVGGLGLPSAGGGGLDGCARAGFPGRGDRFDGASRGGTFSSSASPFGGELFLARPRLSVSRVLRLKDPPQLEGNCGGLFSDLVTHRRRRSCSCPSAARRLRTRRERVSSCLTVEGG